MTLSAIALVIHDCGPHGTDLRNPRKQVKISPLLANCTALHPQMDPGVIALWKVNQRQLMLEEIMETIENQKETKEKRRKG